MKRRFILFSVLAGLVSVSMGAAAADTHSVLAKPPRIWDFNGQSSDTDGTPVVVDVLKAGDTVEIKVGGGSHGFITMKDDAEFRDLVLVCEEAESAKPNAVLKETDCAGGSKFGKDIIGSLKMTVLPNFENDVSFWCTQHGESMQGVLKLANQPEALNATGTEGAAPANSSPEGSD